MAFLLEDPAEGLAVVDEEAEPAADIGVVSLFSLLDDEIKLFVVLSEETEGLAGSEFEGFAEGQNDEFCDC